MGNVVEFAAGTGIWTEKLVRQASYVTALDSSTEVLLVNESKLAGLNAPVTYVHCDIFSWQPDAQYDTAFFGFWLSHVPEERFESFWDLVRRSLRPGGRVFLVDSKGFELSSARDHEAPDMEAGVARRKLNDGSRFDIVKIFYDPSNLNSRLTSLGWRSDIRSTHHFFVYGWGEAA